MALNSNTWYSIQNFGNDYFLGCGNVGSCGAATSGLADQELFQLATVNGNSSYYIRSKAVKANPNGEAYCVNINTGIPIIATCSNQSATWGIGNWNGQDASEGKFFFSTQRGDSQRLYLSINQTYSLLNFAGLSQGNQALMQWGVSSRAAINDQSYSTIPAGITGGSTSTTRPANTTTASASTSSSVSNATTTSGTLSSISNTASATPSSDSGIASTTSQSVSAVAPSTSVVLITPTVTASPTSGAGSSRTSTSTVSPTVVSGAEMSCSGVKTTLVLALVLSQALAFLS